MVRVPPLVVAATLAAALQLGVRPSADAQAIRFASPLPSPSATIVSRDVVYATADTTTLRMDVYRPFAASSPLPALVFFNVAAGNDRRSNEIYIDWARVAASRGLVAIVPDLRQESAPQDFTRLVAHLASKGEAYGLDTAAIAAYAASGNVYTALPVFEDPRQTSLKSAVIYYGTGPVTEFRRDLPLLYVRAGLDRPGVNSAAPNGIAGLASAALAQNVPITVLNHPGGHHAFEIRDTDAVTRDVIDQTIEFVKRTTSAAYQSATRSSLAEAIAAADVLTEHFDDAVRRYADLVARRPDDPTLRLAYGEALLGARQFAAACAELEKLKERGLGYRDLGLPAARACAQSGDADRAIAWLRSIPSRFLPSAVQDDPAFATLRARDDFRGLFARDR